MAFEWHGDKVLGRLRDMLADRLEAAAEVLAEEARAESPVDTGMLRNSIAPDPVDRDALAVDIVVHAEHGIYVEMGTRKMRANPFMRRAIARSKSLIMAILAGKGSSRRKGSAPRVSTPTARPRPAKMKGARRGR